MVYLVGDLWRDFGQRVVGWIFGNGLVSGWDYIGRSGQGGNVSLFAFPSFLSSRYIRCSAEKNIFCFNYSAFFCLCLPFFFVFFFHFLLSALLLTIIMTSSASDIDEKGTLKIPSQFLYLYVVYAL